MRVTRVGMGLLVVTLLSGSGCQTTPNTTIKPPLHEEYTLPPSDDSRFSSPPTYPALQIAPGILGLLNRTLSRDFQPTTSDDEAPNFSFFSWSIGTNLARDARGKQRGLRLSRDPEADILLPNVAMEAGLLA